MTISVGRAVAAFDKCFEILLGHEGGYVDHADDPGGRTRWGISQRSYPKEDIRNLSVERAKAIYKQDYWDACRCDDLPAPLALLVFDAAVNCGPGRSVKWLQKVVGVTQDGTIGPATLSALERTWATKGAATLCRDVLVIRLMHHVGLPTWRTFGLGWARRILSLPFAAVQMTMERSDGV
jgi:lysozyme family protein